MDEQARKIRREIMREYRQEIAETQAKRRAVLEAERRERLALQREAAMERRIMRQMVQKEQRSRIILVLRNNLLTR